MSAKRTILITGFGPFPTAPANPTTALVWRLARERRPALAEVRLVAHVFRTAYEAIDRELPALIDRHRPDALLMFGVAARTPYLRIETSARNAVALLADAERRRPQQPRIAPRQPARRLLPTPAGRLLAAARAASVPAALSRDAGRYVCNYLCWRAIEAAESNDDLSLAAFIHVPAVRRGPTPVARVRKRRVTMTDLIRAGRHLLRATAAMRAN
jgi:pyroglutamyl-peptidase